MPSNKDEQGQCFAETDHDGSGNPVCGDTRPNTPRPSVLLKTKCNWFMCRLQVAHRLASGPAPVWTMMCSCNMQ